MKNKVCVYVLMVGLLGEMSQASYVRPTSALTLAFHDQEIKDNKALYIQEIKDKNLSAFTKTVTKAFNEEKHYKAAGLVANAVADRSFSPDLAKELGDKLITMSAEVFGENPSPVAVAAFVDISENINYVMKLSRINRLQAKYDRLFKEGAPVKELASLKKKINELK